MTFSIEQLGEIDNVVGKWCVARVPPELKSQIDQVLFCHEQDRNFEQMRPRFGWLICSPATTGVQLIERPESGHPLPVQTIPTVQNLPSQLRAEHDLLAVHANALHLVVVVIQSDDPVLYLCRLTIAASRSVRARFIAAVGNAGFTPLKPGLRVASINTFPVTPPLEGSSQEVIVPATICRSALGSHLVEIAQITWVIS